MRAQSRLAGHPYGAGSRLWRERPRRRLGDLSPHVARHGLKHVLSSWLPYRRQGSGSPRLPLHVLMANVSHRVGPCGSPLTRDARHARQHTHPGCLPHEEIGRASPTGGGCVPLSSDVCSSTFDVGVPTAKIENRLRTIVSCLQPVYRLLGDKSLQHDIVFVSQRALKTSWTPRVNITGPLPPISMLR